jgi:hypothetical protein
VPEQPGAIGPAPALPLCAAVPHRQGVSDGMRATGSSRMPVGWRLGAHCTRHWRMRWVTCILRQMSVGLGRDGSLWAIWLAGGRRGCLAEWRGGRRGLRGCAACRWYGGCLPQGGGESTKCLKGWEVVSLSGDGIRVWTAEKGRRFWDEAHRQASRCEGWRVQAQRADACNRQAQRGCSPTRLGWGTVGVTDVSAACGRGYGSGWLGEGCTVGLRWCYVVAASMVVASSCGTGLVAARPEGMAYGGV